MAQNDLHVLMYKVLAYLYSCLKDGNELQREMLMADSIIFPGVSEYYWTVVLQELVDKKLVRGISINSMNNEKRIVIGQYPTITLEGVEFMQENAMMRKALNFLIDVNAALPFTLS